MSSRNSHKDQRRKVMVGTSLPALRRRSLLERTGLAKARRDLQIVNEFRSKLKVAEDLIAKLAFSLREIQHLRRKPKQKKPGKTRSHARVIAIPTRT